MHLKIVKNEKGASLIGVMVAVGIVGIISVAISRLTTGMMSSSRTMQQRFEIMQIQGEIYTLLSDRNTCQANFQNMNPTAAPTAPTQISNLTGVARYVEGNDYASNMLTVSAIDFDAASWTPDGAGVNQYRGQINLNVRFTPIGAGTGLQSYTRQIKLRLQLNGFTGGSPADEISGCLALGGMGDSPIWEQYPDGTIEYLGGSVFIGATGTNLDLTVSQFVNAQAYYHSSDERLKENIQPIDGLELVRQLEGVSFDWKNSGSSEMGLIAQKVEEVAPELVRTDEESGMKSVKYANLVAPLIEATKKLDAENKNLKQLIRDISIRLQTLESKKAAEDEAEN